MSVTVISGANENELNLAGQSVSQVRSAFGQALGIEAGARATVNGRNADDATILNEGDELAFTPGLAEKGRAS